MSVGLGHFDADTRIDLAVLSRETSGAPESFVYIYPGEVGGIFLDDPTVFPVPDHAELLAVGDLDAPGPDDLAVIHEAGTSPNVTLLINLRE
jgi:hypothetical protein